jgi:hypothetical protein
MSGQTIVLPAEEASEEIADAVIKLSQETYALTYVKPIEPTTSNNRVLITAIIYTAKKIKVAESKVMTRTTIARTR